MLQKLIRWLKKAPEKNKNYAGKFVMEIPDRLKPYIIYIISNQSYHWQVVMLCPCGCKKVLHLNLMEEYHPYWKFNIDKNKRISIHPSINRIVGCRSHFFVTKGTIVWCK